MQIGMDRLLSDIAMDKTSGATALALHGLDAMAMLAEILPENTAEAEFLVIDLIRRLHGVRPAMGAIGAQAVRTAIKARSLVVSNGALWSDALRKSVKEDQENGQRVDGDIAELFEGILTSDDIVVSCSSSATVERVLTATQPKQIYLGEGYLLGDGTAAATRLGAKNLTVKVVPDGALPVVAANATAALIGADQVFDNGSVVNRCGSFALALSAHYHGIPLYVACQQIKLAGRKDAPVEASQELMHTLPAEVTGYAPVFDVTPPELIRNIVTENGCLTPFEAGAKGIKVAQILHRILDTGKF